jgi:hypothetical protein
MMSYTDRLGWTKYFEAMTTYRMGGIWVKAVAAYTIAVFIFWVGNMGTRIIEDFWIVKWFKGKEKISFIEIFLLTVILLGFIFPMFFLQSGTPWNTIQFFYYSLFFSGILAGVALGKWVEEGVSNMKPVVVAVIVLLTIPTTIGTLQHYLPSRPPAMISNGELEGLEFLKKQKSGVVLTYPFDRGAADAAVSNPPRPLYLYESNSYVSAFAEKSVYLEDEVNLTISNYDWKDRRKKVESFLDSLDHDSVGSFLKSEGIDYVYWTRGQRARLGESQIGMTKIFENKAVHIYRTN